MRGIDTNICEALEITAGDRLADVKRPAASVILNILSARRIVLTELCKVHLPQPEDTVVSEHFNCHLPVTQELLRSDSCGYIRVGEKPAVAPGAVEGRYGSIQNNDDFMLFWGS